MIATVSSIAAALAPKPSRAPRRSATRASATPPASAIQKPPVGAARAARKETTATWAGPEGAAGAAVARSATVAGASLEAVAQRRRLLAVVHDRLGVSRLPITQPASRCTSSGIVHGSRRYSSGTVPQLGHVAPHVLAVRVDSAPCAARVVEPPEERLGVHADRRDPLPVAVVVRLVAVDQQAHEPALAPAPVDAKVLGQERPDHQPRAVVHPALGAQLAHAGVHQRDSRCGPRTTPRSARSARLQ